jgi:hypothetical protein
MPYLDWYDDPPDPPDPPLYDGYDDDSDDEPPLTWDTHPSLTAEERNSRMHAQ